MTKKKVDNVIIGGGPAGYVAAIRLGQLGKSVTLIERDNIGGVCLNWGCIPSKALINVGKLYEEMQHAQEVGITVKDAHIDLVQTQKWKAGVIKKLTSGIAQLAQSVGVNIVSGTAKFTGPHTIEISGAEGNEDIEFNHAVIAAGSSPIEIPGFQIDGEHVVDSRHALDWTEAPAHLVVIGGGVIGMEMGMLFEKFGSKVSVIEMTDQLFPGMDTEIATSMARLCKKRGIDIYLQAKALGYEVTPNGLKVSLETSEGKKTLDASKVLLAVGRKPDASSLNLDAAGVNFDRGIKTNAKLQTNVPHIFAIGDIAGPPLLAHKASKEGIVAAEVIAGHNIEYDVRAMPGAVFTDPEIASVGLTEAEAKKENIEYFVGKFPFAASGRAMASRHTDGMVKIIAEQKTQRVIGVHMMGEHVSELIGEATLGIEMGACVEDFALTVHPHPTLSECIMESAEAALGKAIHTVNKNVRKAS